MRFTGHFQAVVYRAFGHAANRMMRTIAVALLGWTLAGPGCASRPVPLAPIGTANVKLDPERKSATFTVRNRHLLVLSLPPAAPAHHWEISFHDTRYLKLMSDIQPPAQDGESPTVSFLATTTGRTRLRFVLLPSVDRRRVDPVDQQELIVNIQ